MKERWLVMQVYAVYAVCAVYAVYAVSEHSTLCGGCCAWGGVGGAWRGCVCSKQHQDGCDVVAGFSSPISMVPRLSPATADVCSIARCACS